MPFGQLLAGEGWSEIVPVRLLQNLQSLSLRLARQLAIGGAAAKSMHHHPVASPAHPFQQRPHPTLTHAYSLGRLPLAHPPFLRSLQPIQLIPLLLAHCHSFHPLALRLSRGTFYFGQLGTSHFGATVRWSRAAWNFILAYHKEQNVRRRRTTGTHRTRQGTVRQEGGGYHGRSEEHTSE